MHILPQVYVVGSGEFLLTRDPLAHPFYDCHVYVIDGAAELAIVDAGYGNTTDQILFSMHSWGLDPGRLRYCLITHPHHDHARGAAVWQRKGVRIVSSEATAAALAQPDVRAQAYACPDGKFEPCLVDITVADGQKINVGELTVTALLTPGHTAADTTYWLNLRDGRAAAFIGDLMQCDGVNTDLGYPFSVDRDEHTQVRSLLRLYEQRPDVILPGHGMLGLNDAWRWIGQALHSMDKRGATP